MSIFLNIIMQCISFSKNKSCRQTIYVNKYKKKKNVFVNTFEQWNIKTQISKICQKLRCQILDTVSSNIDRSTYI